MNCIIIDDDHLSRTIIERFISKTEALNLIGSFENPLDSFQIFEKEEPVDLIFLDVEMPEMSGLEFLNSLDFSPMIIIVSGKEKYALESYEYDVVDYLLKPISLPRFYKSVTKAQKRFQDKESISNYPEEIFIKKKNSTLVKLKYDDILWVEALENYVTVNTETEKFTIHFTMKAIENKLPISTFKRVHRSYVVNTKQIMEIEDNSVILKVGNKTKAIPIGKSYKDNLMDDLNLISK
jgi:DNA-binding LytR/AlgR family response regulator